MSRYFHIFLFFITTLTSLNAETVTLDSIPAKVRASHPVLAAAKLKIEEARGRLIGAGRRSNPEVETNLTNNARSSEGGIELGISQKFPLTNRLALEKQVSEGELAAATAEWADVERQLIAEAEALAIEALTLQSRTQLQTEQAKLASSLTESLEAARKRGEKVTEVDVGQAKLDAMQSTLAVKQGEVELAEKIATLKYLLGIEADAELKIGGSLAPPVAPAKKSANPNDRPDYMAALHSAEAAAREVELEKSKRREDISAGFFISADNEIDAPGGAEKEYAIGIKVSIPIPLWNKNEGAIHEKNAKRERLEKEAAALAARIKSEVATHYGQMVGQARVWQETTQSLLPLALAQVERTEKAVKDLQGEVRDVLKAREVQLELESARLAALRDFHLARIQLKAALGQTSLPKNTP